MPSLASVFVDFVARTAGFKEDVASAANSVKSAGQQMASANNDTAQAAEKAAKSAEKSGEMFTKASLQVIVGAHAFRLIREEIKDVIKNIDEIPGISESTIDSIHRMKYAFEGANNSAKNAVATVIGWSADAASAIGYLAGAVIYGGDAATEAYAQMGAEAEKFAAKGFTKEMEKLATQMARLKLTAGEMAAEMIEDARALDKIGEAGGTQKERWDAQLESARLQIEAQKALNTLRKETNHLLTQAGIGEMKHGVAMKSFGDNITDLRAQIKALNVEMKALSGDDWKEFWDDPERVEKYNMALRQQNHLQAELNKELEKQQRHWAQLTSTIGEGLTMAFVDSLNGAEGAWKKFGNMVVQELEKMLVKLLIIRPLFSALGMGVTGLGFSAFGGAIAAYAGAMAVGGDIGSGEFALVGENGPELSARPGTIISNDRIAAAVSGGSGRGGNTYNIDARGADAGVEQRVMQALVQLAGPGVTERRAVVANIGARNRRLAGA